jgi:hypothetical protein
MLFWRTPMDAPTLQLHPAIQRYLTALEAALRKTPGMSSEDALADANEYLQSEWEAIQGHDPPLDDDLFRHFVEKFGTPEEVAAAYAAASEAPSDTAANAGVAAAGTEPIVQIAAIRRRFRLRIAIGSAIVVILAATAAIVCISLAPAARRRLGGVALGPTWADRVVSFTPGNPAPSRSVDPLAALGPPNCRDAYREPETYVALGRGGQLIVEFTGAALYDGEGPDLQIVEIGPLAEAVDVSVSTDGQQWVAIGHAKGAGAMLDIHDWVQPGDRFRFVRLVDLGTVSAAKNQWPGADIDAVGAMHAVKSP